MKSGMKEKEATKITSRTKTAKEVVVEEESQLEKDLATPKEEGVEENKPEKYKYLVVEVKDPNQAVNLDLNGFVEPDSKKETEEDKETMSARAEMTCPILEEES